MISVDVIIPSYTDDKLIGMARDTITTLRASEDFPFNVVVVESLKVVDIGQDSTIMLTDKPFNYNKALNTGARSCNGDWLVFANNDLIFHKNWFTNILKIYDSTDIVSFSPWDKNHAKYHGESGNPYMTGYGTWFTGHIAGWCIALPRKIYDSIDLKEHVEFYYSDDVYGDELQRKGHKHALVRDSRVDHLASITWLGSGLFSEEEKRRMSTGQEKAYSAGKN